MNSNVHPAIVALVLLLTGIAIAVWMWGSGAAAGIGGPAELKSGPDGHHYVQIQHYLVEHDANGGYLETHNLEELGVELFLGTYAFFSNGDVLLRLGPDPRTFGDNLRAYQRKTNNRLIEPETGESGLFRCNLETGVCKRFGEAGVDFKAAHSVFIDWHNDEVYVADTTRHLLRKYAADGAELAAPVGGFKFPNQLLIHDERLLVADTNHHAIRAVSPETASFGDRIESFDVVPSVARLDDRRWPSHFVRVGDEWWVNVMRTGMNQGGLYVFADTWRFERHIGMPGDADPISLLAVDNEVWVSDWNNDRVRRFSAAGQPLPDLESAGLEAILESSRIERRKYEMLGYTGIALFVLVLLGLLARGLAAEMNKGPHRRSGDPAPALPDDVDGALFLEPDEKAVRKMTNALRLAGLMVLMVVALLVYLVVLHDKPEFGIQLVPVVSALVAITLMIAWLGRANMGTFVKIDGDTVTLRDHSGRESTCPIREVRYDACAIATRDAVVFLGRKTAWIYDRNALQEQLVPRLAKARKVSSLNMLQILIELRHPHGIVTVIATIGVIIYMAWVFAERI